MKFGICGGPGTNILVDIKGQLEAERTPCLKGGGQEELPHVRGQGQRPRVPACDGAGTAERSYPASEVRWGQPRGDTQCPRSGVATRGVTPRPRSGTAAGKSNPCPRPGVVARRTNQDQPHVQGAMAARAQEGLEKLSHVEGQEGRR